jgi:hypothetical protein
MNNEPENLSRNDEKLRGILGSLDKIDAPKDFDFQLKSKIANVKSTRGSQAFWRYFMIGVPSLACLLLVTFFAFNRNTTKPPPYIVAEVKEPQITQTPVITVVKMPEGNNNEVAVKPLDEVQNAKKTLPDVEPKVAENKVLAKAENLKNISVENKKVLQKKPTVKESFSADSAVTEIPKPILPKGLNATNASNTQINQSDTVFEIESVLKDLGVETSEENGKLKVKTVKKNSLAERSGIKNDDVIDAVNNQKITPKETRKKAFDAKSINVIRDGKAIELKLQP